MPYDRDQHHRRSIRLKGYDYRQSGAYFVTVCVQGGKCLLGEIWDGEMELNWRGHIVAGAWLWLAERYPYVEMDVWQVMPNHMHGIIVLTDAGMVSPGDVPLHVGAVREPPLQRDEPAVPRDEPPLPHDEPAVQRDIIHNRKTLGRLVGAFKTACTAQINRMQRTEGLRFWQRDFYERIIRNESELVAIRSYIAKNPGAWTDDQLHPAARPNKFNRNWRKDSPS